MKHVSLGASVQSKLTTIYIRFRDVLLLINRSYALPAFLGKMFIAVFYIQIISLNWIEEPSHIKNDAIGKIMFTFCHIMNLQFEEISGAFHWVDGPSVSFYVLFGLTFIWMVCLITTLVVYPERDKYKLYYPIIRAISTFNIVFEWVLWLPFFRLAISAISCTPTVFSTVNCSNYTHPIHVTLGIISILLIIFNLTFAMVFRIDLYYSSANSLAKRFGKSDLVKIFTATSIIAVRNSIEADQTVWRYILFCLHFFWSVYLLTNCILDLTVPNYEISKLSNILSALYLQSAVFISFDLYYPDAYNSLSFGFLWLMAAPAVSKCALTLRARVINRYETCKISSSLSAEFYENLMRHYYQMFKEAKGNQIANLIFKGVMSKQFEENVELEDMLYVARKKKLQNKKLSEDDIKGTKKYILEVIEHWYEVYLDQSKSVDIDLVQSYLLFLMREVKNSIKLYLKMEMLHKRLKVKSFRTEMFFDLLSIEAKNALEEKMRLSISHIESFKKLVNTERHIEELLVDIEANVKEYISLYEALDDLICDNRILLDRATKILTKSNKIEECLTFLLSDSKQSFEVMNLYIYYFSQIRRQPHKSLRVKEMKKELVIQKENLKAYDGLEEVKMDIFDQNGAVVMLSLEKGKMGYVKDTSRRFGSIFGYDEQEIKNKKIDFFMPEEIAVHHDHYLQKFITFGKTSLIRSGGVTLFGVDKDKYVFPLWISIKLEVSHELYLSAFLKRKKTNTRFVLTTKTGEIIGVCRDFAQSVHLEKNFTELHGVNVLLIAPSLVDLYYPKLESYQHEENFNHQLMKIIIPKDLTLLRPFRVQINSRDDLREKIHLTRSLLEGCETNIFKARFNLSTNYYDEGSLCIRHVEISEMKQVLSKQHTKTSHNNMKTRNFATETLMHSELMMKNSINEMLQFKFRPSDGSPHSRLLSEFLALNRQITEKRKSDSPIASLKEVDEKCNYGADRADIEFDEAHNIEEKIEELNDQSKMVGNSTIFDRFSLNGNAMRTLTKEFQIDRLQYESLHNDLPGSQQTMRAGKKNPSAHPSIDNIVSHRTNFQKQSEAVMESGFKTNSLQNLLITSKGIKRDNSDSPLTLPVPRGYGFISEDEVPFRNDLLEEIQPISSEIAVSSSTENAKKSIEIKEKRVTQRIDIVLAEPDLLEREGCKESVGSHFSGGTEVAEQVYKALENKDTSRFITNIKILGIVAIGFAVCLSVIIFALTYLFIRRFQSNITLLDITPNFLSPLGDFSRELETGLFINQGVITDSGFLANLNLTLPLQMARDYNIFKHNYEFNVLNSDLNDEFREFYDSISVSITGGDLINSSSFSLESIILQCIQAMYQISADPVATPWNDIYFLRENYPAIFLAFESVADEATQIASQLQDTLSIFLLINLIIPLAITLMVAALLVPVYSKIFRKMNSIVGLVSTLSKEECRLQVLYYRSQDHMISGRLQVGRTIAEDSLSFGRRNKGRKKSDVKAAKRTRESTGKTIRPNYSLALTIIALFGTIFTFFYSYQYATSKEFIDQFAPHLQELESFGKVKSLTPALFASYYSFLSSYYNSKLAEADKYRSFFNNIQDKFRQLLSDLEKYITYDVPKFRESSGLTSNYSTLLTTIDQGDFCNYLNSSEPVGNCNVLLYGISQKGIYTTLLATNSIILQQINTMNTSNMSQDAIGRMVNSLEFIQSDELQNYLLIALDHVTEIIFDNITSSLSSYRSNRVVYFTCGIALYILLILFLWLPLVSRMNRQLYHSKNVLRLLPIELIRSNKYICNYLSKEANVRILKSFA